MKKQIKCLRCGCQKLYSVRREKKRCSSCGYEWKPDKLPMHLTRKKWSNILRALTYVRNSFQKGTLDIFSDTVEVDETYIGGQWKNKRHSAKAGGSKRGRGTSKTPVFGILYRGGKYGLKWLMM